MEPRTIKLGQRVTVTTRRRKPEPARLSADRIVEVAIGYDAVTMRSVARELGTGPASLYAHVSGRAELDQLVTGKVCAQWRIPDPDPDHWDDQLRTAMTDLLALYRAHPGVARCAMGMIPTEEGVLAVSEKLLAILVAGGVPPQHCAWFVDVASLYVGSVAVEEDIWRERAAGQDVESVTEEAVVAAVHDVFAGLPADRFPLLTAMADTMTTGDADERFAFGVDLLVSGLVALSRR